MTSKFPDVRIIDGKVVDVERRPEMVTMLKLDTGATLTVPPEGSGPGERPPEETTT